MMSKKLIFKLEQAMRFVYAHFLEDGETIGQFLSSRAGKRAKIRHVVRERIYTRMDCTLHQVCQAEGKICSPAPDHSTIFHSVKYVKNEYEPDERAISEVNALLYQFEDYWLGTKDSKIRRRLNHYYSLDKHVLAVILTMAEQFGSANPDYNDLLYKEFQSITPEFIKEL